MLDTEKNIPDILSDAGDNTPDYSCDAPRTLNVLSLFSGCGGMDLGFEGGFICHKKSIGGNEEWKERDINDDWCLLKKNRFHTVFANDILNEAQKAWQNHMERYGVERSTYHLESIVNLVKRHAAGEKIFPDNVDVVTGGFPCQDFSVAGKRKGFDSTMSHDGKRITDDNPTEETRGKLYMWMKQVIDITKPKVFIAENVKGLVSLGDIKAIIQKDFSSADGDGYIVLDPQVLDAGNFGVPETRERVIFIGIRKSALNERAKDKLSQDMVDPEYTPYPSPTHNHSAGDESLPAPLTCRDVLGGLPEPDNSSDLSHRNFSHAKYMGKHCQGQSEIDLDDLGPTIRSEHHGNIEYRRLSAEHGGTKADELNAGLEERRLTPRECALIQTFPPDYSFVFRKEGERKYEVSASGAYKIIGNAVPPMLAYNIAKRLESLWNIYFE